MKNLSLDSGQAKVLDDLFADPLFHRHDGLSPAERNQLTYQRVRLIDKAFPLDRRLPFEPDRLYPLLERAAVADPALFLVLSVHLCVGMAALVEFGACDEHLDGVENLRWLATIQATEIATARATSTCGPRPATTPRTGSSYCTPSTTRHASHPATSPHRTF